MRLSSRYWQLKIYITEKRMTIITRQNIYEDVALKVARNFKDVCVCVFLLNLQCFCDASSTTLLSFRVVRSWGNIDSNRKISSYISSDHKQKVAENMRIMPCMLWMAIKEHFTILALNISRKFSSNWGNLCPVYIRLSIVLIKIDPKLIIKREMKQWVISLFN